MLDSFNKIGEGETGSSRYGNLWSKIEHLAASENPNMVQETVDNIKSKVQELRELDRGRMVIDAQARREANSIREQEIRSGLQKISETIETRQDQKYKEDRERLLKGHLY